MCTIHKMLSQKCAQHKIMFDLNFRIEWAGNYLERIFQLWHSCGIFVFYFSMNIQYAAPMCDTIQFWLFLSFVWSRLVFSFVILNFCLSTEQRLCLISFCIAYAAYLQMPNEYCFAVAAMSTSIDNNWHVFCRHLFHFRITLHLLIVFVCDMRCSGHHYN